MTQQSKPTSLKDRMTRMGQNSLYPNHIIHPMMPTDATPLMQKMVENFCSYNDTWVSTHMDRDFLLSLNKSQYQSHRNGYNASPEQSEAINALVAAEVFELNTTYKPVLILINWV